MSVRGRGRVALRALALLLSFWGIAVLPSMAIAGFPQGLVVALGVAVGIYFALGAVARSQVLRMIARRFGDLSPLGQPRRWDRVRWLEAATPQNFSMTLRTWSGSQTIVVSRGHGLMAQDLRQRSPGVQRGSVTETIGIWFSFQWDLSTDPHRPWTPRRAWIVSVFYPGWRWLNKIGLYTPSL